MRDRELGAVARGLGLLADTWTLLILQQAFLGVRRYAGWRDSLSISHATLSARLRALVDDGLLGPRPYSDGVRVRQEYVLTERGRDLWTLLVVIWDWERTWIPRERPLPPIVHSSCGQDSRPRAACARCDVPVGPRDTEVFRTPGSPGPEVLSRRHPRRTRGPLPQDPLSQLPGAMEVLGDRWGATVLGGALAGLRSFGALLAELGISPDVLSDRLYRLVDLGLLERRPTGAYRLTRRGRATFPIYAGLVEWSHRWPGAVDGRPIDLTIRHRRCDEPLRLLLRCDRCGGPVDRTTVSPVRPR